MAVLALIGSELTMGVYATEIAPAAAMGEDSQVGRRKTFVAIAAVLHLMTGDAQLGVGTGCKRVADMKIRAMDIDQAGAELPSLIAKSSLMTLQAELLFVAGCTIHGLRLNFITMVHRPSQVMGFQAGEDNLVDKLLIMTLQTDFTIRLDTFGVRQMTARAGRGLGFYEVSGMIEISGPGRHYRQKHEQSRKQYITYHGTPP